MKNYFYDFHIHSALSPCADDDMTPNNIVNMAMLNGLDIIALTDHNSTKNCRAVEKVAKEQGVIFIPGMELCTSEEIHTVCLFPTVEDASAFDLEIYGGIMPIKNKPDIYGNQLILDENDNVTGIEDILLVTASSVPLYDVVALVEKYNGIALLAHIDRHSSGVLGILGNIDPDMGFCLAEVSKNATDGRYQDKFPFLSFVSDSDAHHLWDIAEASENNVISGNFFSSSEVIDYFRSYSRKIS